MRPRAILETALYCDDLDAAEAFYGRVLGLERISRVDGRHLFYRCGPGVLLLFVAEHTARVATEVGGARIPLHGAHGPGHLAFRAHPDERDRWREHLLGHDVAIESEVEWPRGGWSLYFRDPAGNSLEIATAELWGV